MRCSPATDDSSVAVDTDVGQRRTGVTDLAEGVRLAQMIAAASAAALRRHPGLCRARSAHSRSAGAQGCRRRRRTDVAHLRRDAADAGLPPKLITGSGTGTYRQDSEGPYNELQVGSYVFMDSDYARIVDERGAGPTVRAQSLRARDSRVGQRAGQVTVDAGTKALATNGPPPCHIVGAPEGSTYRFGGDEHGIIAIPAGHAAPALGDRLLIGATHCDPTVNLHAAYHVVENDTVQTWPIRARYGDGATKPLEAGSGLLPRPFGRGVG